MKAILLHYPDTPTKELQAYVLSLASFLRPCKFMTVYYGVYGTTGVHQLGYIWSQTAVSDRIGLTSNLWPFVHFYEHTVAAFLAQCMEEPTLGFPPTPPPTPPTSSLPIPYKLNP